MVALRQLILSIECSQLQICLLNFFILLINLILNDGSELLLHIPDLRRNNIPEGLAIVRYLEQLIVAGRIKLHEVLRIGYLNFVVWGNWLEEDGLRLIRRHITQLLRLLSLILIIRLVFRRNRRNDRLNGSEQLGRPDSRARGVAHILSEVLGFLEAMDSKHLPGTRLKVLLVVEHNAGELALAEGFKNPIRLTQRIRLLEVVRNLQSNLGKHLWLHFLLSGHLVKEVLGLRKHEIAEHAEALRCKVGADLGWLKLCHILFEIIK